MQSPFFRLQFRDSVSADLMGEEILSLNSCKLLLGISSNLIIRKAEMTLAEIENVRRAQGFHGYGEEERTLVMAQQAYGYSGRKADWDRILENVTCENGSILFNVADICAE